MDYGAGVRDSRSRFLGNPLPESFRGPWPPPLSPRGGDPNAQAKFIRPEGSEVYPRSGEKPFEFYNVNNPYGAGACDSGSRFSTNPLPESFRAPWQLPPPLSSRGGDLKAQAKIKCPQGLEVYRRSAEKSIEFYNMNNPGADFEAVEILAVNFFFSCGTNYHMNFKARPKTAADDDHHSVRIFFAELISFESLTRDDFSYRGEGETFTCSLLGEGSTAFGCSGCFPNKGILHPPQGFYTGNVRSPEPVLWQKWLALREHEYRNKPPPDMNMASYFHGFLSQWRRD